MKSAASLIASDTAPPAGLDGELQASEKTAITLPLDPPKPYAIVTGCNAKYGDFLLTHWLRSLQDNVNLDKIDVVVLDYGLTDAQSDELARRCVRCFPSRHDGFVGNLRYRDIVRLLDDTPYEQVLSCDAGDIIFQADISELFAERSPSFRGVVETVRTPFYETLMKHDDVRPEYLSVMLDYLDDKPIINSGFLVGPAARFREFWGVYQEYCRDFSCYGVDQFALNYFAYRNACFKAIEEKYNFILIATARRFLIRDGVFYDADGAVIPVVHNAGYRPSLRVVDRFGYGLEFNRNRPLTRRLVRLGVHGLRAWHDAGKRMRAFFRTE